MTESIHRRPVFSSVQAEDLALQHFGMTCKAKRLPGERDLNFQLDGPTGKYTLKLANYDADLEWLQFENQAIRLCQATDGVSTPVPVKALDHESIVSVVIDDEPCFARCFTYVPGIPLAHVKQRSPALIQYLGWCLGQIDRSLALLKDHKLAQRELKWDLDRSSDVVAQNLNKVIDSERRQIVEHFRAQHAQQADRIAALEKGLIHNDANDYNWILHVDPETGAYDVGLIDFGDMMVSTRVNELAICCAYLMLDVDDPVETAGQAIAGYHQSIELSDGEISVLFWLIAMRLCQSVCIAAQQKQWRPDDEYLSISEKPAWALLERLRHLEVEHVTSVWRRACFGADTESENGGPSELDAITAARRAHVAPSLSLSYQRPLHIVRGRAQYLYSDNDVTYLDCVNNVCHVGHCHPKVVEAITAQASTLNTNTRYLHANLATLAHRLTGKLPDPLEVCFFVNSGSEANDLAVRLATAFTGRREFVVIDHAYHGHTETLIGLSPYKFAGAGGKGKADNVLVLPMPDGFRGQWRYEQDGYPQSFAEQAATLIDSTAQAGRLPAALFAESLLGCGGQVPLPMGYLKHVYDAIRRWGGVCVADEVQVGFGRVGDAFWGFELQAVVPDIVTMGKPFGNGHPLAAVVTTRAIADAFNNGMEYFNTFGGNPVSCAVGLAVLDVIEDEGLQLHAQQVGQFLLEQLQILKGQFPQVGDVRGHGLFLGIELVDARKADKPDAELASRLVEGMKKRNILLSTDGPDHNVIKFKPPMVFDLSNAERLISTLERTLVELVGR